MSDSYFLAIIFSHRSYKSCTLDALGKEYSKYFDCLPPWFTSDYNKVCEGPLNSTEIDIIDHLIYKHLDTAEFQGCKQPCKRLDITLRKIRFYLVWIGKIILLIL